MSGDYAETDLEKLQGHDVYSFRLNKRQRLLFTLIKVDGKDYLLWLDYLPTHDYQKSRFLRSGVLRHYLEKNAELHQALVSDQEFAPAGAEAAAIIAERLRAGAEGTVGSAVVLDFYHQRVIQLSAEQSRALQVTLPAVIGGTAGSGKSCLAMTLLTNYVLSCTQQGAAEALRPILYVSHSEPLVSAMKKAWAELPVSEVIPGLVQFKTYDELLLEHVAMQGKTLVGRADFEAWYNEHRHVYQKRTQVQKLSDDSVDSETAYQEFRICSYYSKKDYQDLGKRQSSLTDAKQKAWLYTAYQNYLSSLTARHCIAPAFRLDLHDLYDLIVVDEAQDLSHLQLDNLRNLACKQAIVCCMDSHQSLSDIRSKRPFLLQMLGVKPSGHVELSVTYRCPLKVVHVANEVIAFKHRLMGGTTDKDEATRIGAIDQEKEMGHVFMLNEQALAENAWLMEKAQGTHLAVVTSKEYKEQAKKIFNTPLVFTPEEIKGLEYDVVIATHLYHDDFFKKARLRLEELGDKEQPTHQAKANVGDNTYGPFLNQIYTSYTRAKMALVICEEQTPLTEVLLARFRSIVDKGLPTDACLSVESGADDWLAQAILQLQVGNEALAFDICKSKLGYDETAFRAFVGAQQHTREPKLKVTSPPPAVEERHTVDTNPVASPQISLQTAVVAVPEKKSHPSTKTSTVESKKPTTAAASTSPLELKILLQLVKDFNLLRLTTSLKLICKNMNTDKCLLEISFSKEDEHPNTFFQQLVNDTEKMQLFIECLEQNPDLVKKIATDKFIKHIQNSSATSLIKTKLFRAFLLHNADLLKSVMIMQWLKETLRNDPDAGTEEGLLYYLTKNFSSLSFLMALLIKNPKILLSIPPNVWGMPCSTAGVNANVTVLYRLTETAEGQDILRAILEKRPEIIKNIPEPAWGLARTEAAGEAANTTPLYKLASTKTGQIILKTMAEHFISKFAAIPVSAWYLPRSTEAGDEANTTPLYWLTTTQEGIEVLKLLAEQYPNVMAAIPAAAWALARPAEAGDEANTTPLYWLTTTQEGIEFLKLLAEKYPNVMAAIPAAAWALARTAEAGEDANTTPLYWLTENLEGVEVLKLLVEKYPDVISAIPAAAWSLARPAEAAGESANKTPLDMLSETAEGRAILMQLSVVLERTKLLTEASLRTTESTPQTTEVIKDVSLGQLVATIGMFQEARVSEKASASIPTAINSPHL